MTTHAERSPECYAVPVEVGYDCLCTSCGWTGKAEDAQPNPEAKPEKQPTIESLQAQFKMLTWALGVMCDQAQFYEKHLKEILCASDEVVAEDLRSHAGKALEEADWTDEEIAKARAVLGGRHG